MKKIIFIVVCLVSLVGFSSCGSTSPCGLAKSDKTQQNQQQQEIVVADATEVIE